jgi:hypothetical protein
VGGRPNPHTRFWCAGAPTQARVLWCAGAPTRVRALRFGVAYGVRSAPVPWPPLRGVPPRTSWASAIQTITRWFHRPHACGSVLARRRAHPTRACRGAAPHNRPALSDAVPVPTPSKTPSSAPSTSTTASHPMTPTPPSTTLGLVGRGFSEPRLSRGPKHCGTCCGKLGIGGWCLQDFWGAAMRFNCVSFCGFGAVSDGGVGLGEALTAGAESRRFGRGVCMISPEIPVGS